MDESALAIAISIISLAISAINIGLIYWWYKYEKTEPVKTPGG